MPTDYLHNHPEFRTLLTVVEETTGIQAALVEKDYWIMHTLYGLTQSGFDFELKGGTSLSKAYGIIHRFSEDIDIYIHPPKAQGVNENPNNTKNKAVEGRKNFYDWLADHIRIEGIVSVERDTDFDNTASYSSGGIRLRYNNTQDQVEGLKAGILLEAGFDTVNPNMPMTISSWAYDYASTRVDILDNRAVNIKCYHPGYTFVEKLQTIATKFRKEQEGAAVNSTNFMRQYYDIYCLLENEQVIAFIGTEEYQQHKLKRFPKADRDILLVENDAFRLTNPEIRTDFTRRYVSTKALYYKGQPDFEDVLARIEEHIAKL